MFQKYKTPLSEAQNNLAYMSTGSKTEQREIERIFARLFSSEDGKRALAYLQLMTFNRAGSGNSSDMQLRHMEGQRSLMASILRLIDRGRQG